MMLRAATASGIAVLFLIFGGAAGCSTLPTPEVKKYAFPRQDVLLGEPARPYEVLGIVRTSAHWPSLLLPGANDEYLCRNYYNKAAVDLLKRAREAGAEAVIQVRSVVFYMTGKRETYTTPECSDDGENGEILLEGVAIRYKKSEETPPAVLPKSPNS